MHACQVAIDGYTWIHKAAYMASLELVIGIETDKYCNYITHRIGVLRNCGVTPIFVMDGRRAPLKKETEVKRTQRREEYERRGRELWKEANRLPEGDLKMTRLREANEFFQKV